MLVPGARACCVRACLVLVLVLCLCLVLAFTVLSCLELTITCLVGAHGCGMLVFGDRA